MFRAGFVGGLFTEQHEDVKDDEEYSGEAFGAPLDDIQHRAFAMPHEHCAQANGEKNNRENQTNVL
jgi:hypothetical protein